MAFWKKLALFAYMALFFYGMPVAHAATIHAVLIGDTLDPIIGGTVQTDIDRMNRLLQAIANSGDLDLSLHIFDGDEYQPRPIFDYVKNLQVDDDDVVFYYHSSHGFRGRSMKEAWPALYFGGNDEHLRLQYHS